MNHLKGTSNQNPISYYIFGIVQLLYSEIKHYDWMLQVMLHIFTNQSILFQSIIGSYSKRLIRYFVKFCSSNNAALKLPQLRVKRQKDFFAVLDRAHKVGCVPKWLN